MFCFSIVIISNWLGNPANFKATNKDQKIYVGRSTTLHNLLFCAHTLWLNYVTVTFLLVSSLSAYHDLLCLCRVMAKKANQNIEQRILPSFLTIYLNYGFSQVCLEKKRLFPVYLPFSCHSKLKWSFQISWNPTSNYR